MKYHAAAPRTAILAPMPGANADLVRTVYGFNWAAIGERERGLEAAGR